MLTSLSLIFLVGLAMGAISPAVVVPRMVSLMEQKYGTEKAIPQMIMAGASCDDIFVIVLFVLVGAAVDIRYTLEAGIAAVLMILIALLFRSIGVCICTMKTSLNGKERLFCVLAYLPKATVQAAIGSVPLAAGLPCGKIILSVAVLAILITAPIGAIGIDSTYKRFLEKQKQ